jgi:hypothetical protein
MCVRDAILNLDVLTSSISLSIRFLLHINNPKEVQGPSYFWL